MTIEDARRQALPALKALCELPNFSKNDVENAWECIINSYTDLDFLTDEKPVINLSIKEIIVNELKYYLDELNKK